MSSRRVDEDEHATLRQFATFGAVTPLVSLGDDDGSEDDSPGSSDTRDAVVGHVASTPGTHFSKVHDNLQLGTGETQYRLRNLVNDGTLEASRDNGYRRFLPTGRSSEFEQVTLGYLCRNTPRRVLIRLLRDPVATRSELAARLGVS